MDRPFIRPKDMEAPAFFGANTRAIATADEPLSLVLGETALPITSYKETGAICRTLCLDSEPGTFLSGKEMVKFLEDDDKLNTSLMEEAGFVMK